MSSRSDLAIVVEQGAKRTFASALAWPGWSRSAKTKDGTDAALDALREYEGRYGLVAVRAVGDDWVPGLPFEVVETVAGNATTDFGAPGVQAAVEASPLTGAEAERFVRLYEVSWQLLAEAGTSAPAELRKGPRGGGRDTADIVRHTAAAEAAYARKLGLTVTKDADPVDRRQVVAALRAAAADPSPTPWPLGYAIRRMVWHVLDHVWEIEDRSQPER